MGKRDGNEKLVQFAKDLEQCCVDAVDIDGVMTKDLALSIYGKGMKREHYATTEGFLDHIRVSLILHFSLLSFLVWLLMIRHVLRKPSPPNLRCTASYKNSAYDFLCFRNIISPSPAVFLPSYDFQRRCECERGQVFNVGEFSLSRIFRPKFAVLLSF